MKAIFKLPKRKQVIIIDYQIKLFKKFLKGCYCHIICDKITFFEIKILLPLNIFKRGNMHFKWVSDKWEIFT